VAGSQMGGTKIDGVPPLHTPRVQVHKPGKTTLNLISAAADWL
jgi:hypothetical protein